mmetsp:Transcript_12225/g.16876  ORF Transcript_12225/g.16876 Transcript_12225/m.16876 type:complete len:232 (-) Transcript_12225:298-993(-)
MMLRTVTTTVASIASVAVARPSSSVVQNILRHSLRRRCFLSPSAVLSIRGGGGVEQNDLSSNNSTSREMSTSASETKYVKLADPAPGSPFHYAFPVHNLDEAKKFYGEVLGCEEGRSSEKWQDYSLHGHQIVCHWVGNDYRCQDYYNPVDGDDIPVPHMGLALTEEQFHALAERVKAAGIQFIIEPHLRFQGQPGEQWTMFFKDQSGNNLEFKAMTTIDNLFAKYNVVDEE